MLQSRIALISGGGSGLGRAAATRLLQLGARVLIADLPSSEGASVAAELGANAAFAAADCTDTAQVSQALDECERVFGKPVNVAVNCAGVLCASKTLNRKGAAHALELFEQARCGRFPNGWRPWMCGCCYTSAWMCVLHVWCSGTYLFYKRATLCSLPSEIKSRSQMMRRNGNGD